MTRGTIPRDPPLIMLPARLRRPLALVRWLDWTLIALLALLIVTGAGRLASATQPTIPFGDEGSYIEVGQRLARGDGFSTATKIHFYGENDAVVHPEDNRQPLFPLLLALVFRFTGPDYFAAQMVSYTFGLFALIMTYLLGAAVFNRLSGLLAATALALQESHRLFGTRPWTEEIFTFFLLLALWLAYRRRPLGLPSAVVLGVALGLAYLTRTNGLWVILAFIAYLAGGAAWRRWGPARLRDTPGLFRDRRALIAWALATFLVCLPWFVRNTLDFGNPVYAFVQHVNWLDRWEDAFSLRPSPPTLGEYLRTHGVAEALSRLAIGSLNWLDSSVLGNEVFRYWPLALLGIGLLAQWRRHALIYLVYGLQIVFLVWTAAAFAVDRFFVPFIPLLLIWAFGTVVSVATRGWGMLAGRGPTPQRPSPPRPPSPAPRGEGREETPLSGREGSRIPSGWGGEGRPRLGALARRLLRHSGRYALILVVSLLLFLPAYKNLPPGPFKLGDPWSGTYPLKTVALWLRDNTEPGTVIMEYLDVHQLIYLYDRPTVFIPNSNSAVAIFDTADRYGVQYFIISRATLQQRPALKSFWLDTPFSLQLARAELPDFLRPVYRDPSGEYLIYRFDAAAYRAYAQEFRSQKSE